MGTDKKKIVINSTEDMLAALDSGDMSRIVAVLRAIALDPKKALSYGSGGERDLTAELEKRFLSAKGNIYKTGYFAAMTAIDAPEYLEAYKKGFFMHDIPEIMLASASRLAERPESDTRPFLAAALFNEAMPKQAQLAANIMIRFTGLEAREAIRVALLANSEDSATPPLNNKTLAAWIAELGGPYREAAIRLLEHDAGENGYKFLKAQWSDLPLSVRIWVLEWGARDHPVHALDLIADSLGSGNRDLMLAALRGLDARPEFAKLMEHTVTALFCSDDRNMHIAALRAMHESNEQIVTKVRGDEEALVIAVKKLPATKENEKLLFDLLNEGSWAVRSIATNKLLALGPSAAAFAEKPDSSGLGVGAEVALSRISFSSLEEASERRV